MSALSLRRAGGGRARSWYVCAVPTLDDLVTVVPRDVFADACARARRAAGSTGVEMPPRDRLLWDVPHAIAEQLWAAGLQPHALLDLLFELFDRMPCYPVLTELAARWEELADTERAWVIGRLRRVLMTPDPGPARVVAYALWTDFLEHAGRVDEVWNGLCAPPAADLLLERLLPIAGPVPWDLKAPLYGRLLPHYRWHPALFQSLLQSALTNGGQVDRAAARTLLAELHLPRGTPFLDELRRALA
jgi:hypothetical protein